MNSFATQFKIIGNVIADNDNLILKSSTGEELGRIINGKLVISDAQIIKIPKGYRPEAKLYMSVEEITKHNNLFEKDGAAFIVRKGADVVKSPHSNQVARKFVGLKSEMEQIKTIAGTDLDVYKNKLNLGDKYFEEADELYYVIVDPKKGFKFDTPNGNEVGAYDNQWVPRGKTKNGTSEAVLLNSEKLEHNNSWDAFLNFYGKDNVILIKKYKANGK